MSEQVETQTENGVKCFVGNISFKTTDEVMKSSFQSAGAVVVKVEIVRHGNRALGYCFVTVETQEQADKAVAALNGSEIEGRLVKVEVARPQERRELGQQRNTRPRKNQNAAEGESTGNTKTRQPRGPRRPQGDKVASGSDGVAAITEGVAGTKIENQTSKTPRHREPRAPREAPTGPESKTKVFVANLPYSTDDQQLKEAFEAKGLQVVSAEVKTRFVRARPSKNGEAQQEESGRKQSKGFGFVEFADEKNQKAAVALNDQITLDNRALSVKAAVDQQPKDAQDATAVEA